MRCQRQLLNIHWSDHVTNMSVRESTGLTKINQYLRRQRLSISATSHGSIQQSLQTLQCDWQSTQNKAGDRIRAGVVVQADLDIPGRIKFAKMPEFPCQRYGLLRLPRVTERRDGPRPGENDDNDDPLSSRFTKCVKMTSCGNNV